MRASKKTKKALASISSDEGGSLVREVAKMYTSQSEPTEPSSDSDSSSEDEICIEADVKMQPKLTKTGSVIIPEGERMKINLLREKEGEGETIYLNEKEVVWERTKKKNAKKKGKKKKNKNENNNKKREKEKSDGKKGYLNLKNERISNKFLIETYSLGTVVFNAYYKKKRVFIKQFNPDFYDDYNLFWKSLKEEVDLFKQSKHLAKYMGMYRMKGKLGMVYQQKTGKSLKGLIIHCKKNKKTIPRKNKIRMVLQICKGLKSLHECGLTHRRLNAENIIFSRNGNVQIINYMGNKYDELEISKSRNTIKLGHLNTYYQPPKWKVNNPLTQADDIYSFGVIIWEILNEKLKPFKGKNIERSSKRKIKKINPKLKKDPKLKFLITIMEKCLLEDQKKRITIDKILSEIMQNFIDY